MSIGQSSPGWAPVDAGLRQYLETIRRFPILSREEESRLARLVREEGDRAAAGSVREPRVTHIDQEVHARAHRIVWILVRRHAVLIGV